MSHLGTSTIPAKWRGKSQNEGPKEREQTEQTEIQKFKRGEKGTIYEHKFDTNVQTQVYNAPEAEMKSFLVQITRKGTDKVKHESYASCGEDRGIVFIFSKQIKLVWCMASNALVKENNEQVEGNKKKKEGQE